jgi:large subunit ribosomal protein L10
MFVKAMEASENEYGDLPTVLTGNSAIFTFRDCKCSWKIIKISVRNQPLLKGAYTMRKFILR